MWAHSRPCTIGLVFVCMLAGVSISATASSVGVTGYGYAGNDSDGLSLSAGIFSTFSAAPIGPGLLGTGMVGVPMSLSFSSVAWPGPGFTVVNFGTQFTDILTGGIVFTTGTFTVPAAALMTGVFTTSVEVLGQVMAYQDLSHDGIQGPLMATLSFAGTGTVTLYLVDEGEGFFLITSAQGNFNNITGTLTSVPEPASMLLVATGFAILRTRAGRTRGFLRRIRGGFHANML